MRVLASKCDGLVFVGMMALQIMHVLGMPVPLYLVEHQAVKEAQEIVRYAERKSIPILLPSDFLCKHRHLQMQVETFSAQNILDGKLLHLYSLLFVRVSTFPAISTNLRTEDHLCFC